MADFTAALGQKPVYGLRANSLKITPSRLRDYLALTLGLPADRFQPIAWTDDGFSIPPDLQPGRLPAYAAGLYYIQEPSAMLPAMVLDARPGERVLDLCAAPGGKTCKIAASLRGKGLLWANEISPARARALLRNVELTGCTNCLITRETPERLVEHLIRSGSRLFDKILVDAPCSGSGMFRRDPSAVASWLSYGSAHYIPMQREILRAAWPMLRPGGKMVYSTCTFALAENEGMIQWMLDEFRDCRIVPFDKPEGVTDGLPLGDGMTGTARIWPHLAAGEGHFCALLEKKSNGESSEQASVFASWKDSGEDNPGEGAFHRFCQDNLSGSGRRKIAALISEGRLRNEHQNLHLVPSSMDLPDRLGLVKTGLFLGSLRTLAGGTAVFEPSQAFLLSLQAADLGSVVHGEAGSDLIRRCLRGETLWVDPPWQAAEGRYVAVLLEGSEQAWPLGWTKMQSGGFMKNLYPKAWRNRA